MREIHLQDNTISELPSGVFTGLTRLKELNLEDNIISELPSDMFTGLTGLKELHLQRTTSVRYHQVCSLG